MWATVLALVWLHGVKADAKDEWELLALKAATWLRSHNGNLFLLFICYERVITYSVLSVEAQVQISIKQIKMLAHYTREQLLFVK